MSESKTEKSGTKIIFVISKDTIMNEEVRENTSPTAGNVEDQSNLVTSCLFQEGEVLDYEFIPTFSNYFYAFTSLVLSDYGSMSSLGTDGRLSELKRLTRLAVFTLCVVFQIIVLLIEVSGVYIVMEAENNELYIYMLLLNSSLSVFACSQLLNIILRKRASLLKLFWHPKLVVYRHNSVHYDYNMRKALRAAKVFIYGVIVSGIIHAAVSGLGESGWTFSEFLNANADTFRAVNSRKASSDDNSTKGSIPDEGIELGTIFLGIIGCVFQYASFVTWSFVEGLFLFAALTMKQVADKFGNTFKGSRAQALYVKHTYEFMFRATSNLNIIIGGILAVFHIQQFLYFVLILRFTVAEGSVLDWISALRVLPEFVVTCSAYYYATRIPYKMDAFRLWIRKKRNQEKIGLDSVTTQHLLDEMKTDSIGIGKGVFQVNAEMMAKLASSIGPSFLVIAPVTKP